MKRVDKKIRVSIDEITGNHFFIGRVRHHSETASKLYLPVGLEGKTVIVIVREEG